MMVVYMVNMASHVQQTPFGSRDAWEVRGMVAQPARTERYRLQLLDTDVQASVIWSWRLTSHQGS